MGKPEDGEAAACGKKIRYNRHLANVDSTAIH